MNGTEQRTLVVLNRMLTGDLSAAQAATAWGRSVRQVRRLVAGYRTEGAAERAGWPIGRHPACLSLCKPGDRMVAR